MRGLETPLQLYKKPTLQGAGVGVETEAISVGTQVAVLWCGQASDSYHLNSEFFHH